MPTIQSKNNYFVNYVKKKFFEVSKVKYWVQFRISEFSDFLQTSYTYVFRRADYEYDSENERQGDFHGKTMKKP